MKSVIVLTVATLATVLAATTTTPKPAPEVKSDAAEGRRHHHPYGGYNGYPYYGGPQFLPPLLQDRFVCDLDASVLLITQNQHNHHFGAPSRAVRVKCSEVASYDEDSCNLCCQQTARRDTTLANDKLFGFLAITSQEDTPSETFKTRAKRDVEEEIEEEEEEIEDDDEEHRGRRRFHNVKPTYLKNADWNPDPYFTNVKCVCCAPKPAPVVFAAPATYGNVAAAQPAASTSYGAAAAPASQPATTYGAAAAPAQPIYGAWGAAADTTSTGTINNSY